MNNKKLDNKGYIAPATMLIILFICLLFFEVLYVRTVGVAVDVKDASTIVDNMNRSKSGVERTQALLSENVSYEGEVNYKDLDRKYEISNINDSYEPIILESNSTPLKFKVSNATEINVTLTVFPIDSESPFSYNAELLYNNKNLLLDSQDLQYDFQQIVSSDNVYNKTTQKTNYGEYTLNVTEMNNCIVQMKVKYNYLKTRELLLKGNDIERKIAIQNGENPSVKFKEGGN